VIHAGDFFRIRFTNWANKERFNIFFVCGPVLVLWANSLTFAFFVEFILYRQHHQHAIVARNPGLANPDISKIIGELWKAESGDSKKYWQDLAQVCS
jgi:hypothetical protein